MATQTLIVKLHYGTDIRRFTVKDPNAVNNADLTWTAISERVARSFDLGEKKKIKITYVDDEKDIITISCDDELKEAVELALSNEPAVLRLTIYKKNDKPASLDKAAEAKPTDVKAEAKPSEPKPALPTLPDMPPELAPFLESLAKQLPAAMASLPEGLKTMLPLAELDLGATIAANAPGARHADPYCPAEPHVAGATEGVHQGVTCDKSGQCPIVGNRYHLIGHNYDLCEAEYLKLNDKEKALFRKVAPPSVPSDKAKEGATTNTSNHDDTPPANTVHPGVSCDRSGMSPIVGMRYNLRGHNYDLCQAEFDKLPEVEKVLYSAIPPPPLNHGGPWRPGPWGWRGGCGKKWGGMGGHGMGGHGMGGHGTGHHNGEHCKMAARFVRDVTIFDGTQMAPGTVFTKIWRLKNVGEVPWPQGARMLFVGGDQMTNEASVALSRANAVLPGEEVDVAVEMTAPAEHGRYLGYWRLTGPHMRRKFGQRVWCHVQVVDPSQSGVEAFDDLPSTLAEIERKKSDLAADDDKADETVDDELEAAKAASLASHMNLTDADLYDDIKSDPRGAALDAELLSKATTEEPVMAPADVSDADAAPVPATLVAVEADAPAAPAQSPLTTDDAKDTTDDAKDDTTSDDGILVTDGMIAEANSDKKRAEGASLPTTTSTKAEGKAPVAAVAAPAAAGPSGGVRAELAAMGFTDAAMLEAVIEKNGDDVEAAARDLAAATEWDHLLDDLAEMGFANRQLNTTLMLKNGGNMKRTVRDLVEA